MQRFRKMSRLAVLALGVVVAFAALASASAQQEPPHRFYGSGATAGDAITVHDADGNELGSTTVGDDGSWYVDVDRDEAGSAMFYLNGEHAAAEITSTGSGQSSVVLTVAMMDGDSMDDGSMEDGDELESLEGEGDSMDDGSMDDGSMDDGSMDDGTMEDTEYPGTGSGGLADGSGVSAGLIGLLIALSVAAVAGLGLRRVRNRA